MQSMQTARKLLKGNRCSTVLQRRRLHNKFTNLYNALEKMPFRYILEYQDEKDIAHIEVYKCRADTYKSKLYDNLHELIHLIATNDSRQSNNRRCIAILNNIIESNFYKNDVQAFIDGWQRYKENGGVYHLEIAV